MKNLIQKIFANSALYVILCLLISTSSCGGGKSVEIEVEAGQQTLAALDKAINTLQSESVNWQQVLQETRDDLIDEANSSIKNEVTNLINNGIAATGIEVRCNVDFMRNRARQELIHIRNKLAQEMEVSLLPESDLEPGLCQVTPSSIDLNLTPERRPELKLAGYDFNKSTVSVLLLNDDQEVDVTSKLAQPTKYLLTLNLSPANGIVFSEKSNKVLVRTAQEGKVISEINIIQPAASPLVPLMLYWNGQREDNATIATVAARQSQEQSGYSGPNIQGCIFSERQPETIPLLLFWNQEREDNSTVATPDMIQSQKDSGYGNPAIQGYIYANQQPGTIPLLLFWNQEREDNSTVATSDMIQSQKDSGYGNPAIQGYIYPTDRCK